MKSLSNKIDSLSPQKRALLKKLMKEKGISDVESNKQEIPQRPEGGKHYPLSSSQSRLWFLEQFDDTNDVFNVHAAIELLKPLDADTLEHSFNKIVERHEALRTRFIKIDGSPYQYVVTDNSIDYNFKDISKLIDKERINEQLKLHIENNKTKKFNIETGPLIRATLIKVEQQKQVLLLALHHIVSDGTSIQVLLKELFNNYFKLDANTNLDITPLQIQYIDYACWQQDLLKSAKIDSELDYWKQKLEGAPSHLNLPTDSLRPNSMTYEGKAISFTISKSILDNLKGRAKILNCSLFMLGLAAKNILLARYLGETDIVIGTDITNRNNKQLEPLIGFFINQLVLRSSWQGDLTLNEICEITRKTCLEAYSHKDIPFNYLVEQLNVERDPSRSPLFQTKFVIDNSGGAVSSHSDFKLIDTEVSTLEFDLEIAFKEVDDTLEGQFKYKTSIYSTNMAKNMVSHYIQILKEISDNPQIKISQLKLLDDKQKAYLDSFNNTETSRLKTSFVDDLLNKYSLKSLNGSVTVQGYTINYSQLKNDVENLAAQLLQRNVGVEQVVAICLPRGVDLLVTQLAILRIGACYVPIDIGFGVERINYILNDCSAKLMISNRELSESFTKNNIDLHILERGWQSNEQETPVEWPVTTPCNLAYIMYTSGSTGKPKGVAVNLKGLSNFLYSMKDTIALSEKDTFLSVTTCAFDISGLEFYLPLLCSADLIIATEEQLLDSHQLWTLVEEKKVTHLQATPATWRGISAIANGRKLKHLNALSGGEALPRNLSQELIKLCKSVRNLYGPTETTIWSSSTAIDKNLIKHCDNAPLGQPIDNTKFYILDPFGNQQLTGVPGELCISGQGLARCYWNKAKLTAASFIPDSFSDVPGSRLYRTGDKVKLTHDGRLEYLGRFDHQVKIRGYRIELGEIESVLSSHSNVKQVVVIECRDAMDLSSLHAFVTLINPNQTFNVEEQLLNYAQDFLPNYMLPAQLSVVKQFPLTANGKLNRKELMSQAEESANAKRSKMSLPHSDLEKEVAQIWSDILKVDQVYLEENFFQNGGHSLLAIQLLDSIEKKLGCRISLRDFFQQATLANLVELIKRNDKNVKHDIKIIRDLENRHQPFALTDLQQAYLIGRNSDFDLGGIGTQNYIEIDITNLDIEHFINCWNILIERHEMLRAVFDANGMQRILPKVPRYTPDYNDLSALPENEIDNFINKLRKEMSQQTLAQDIGPLFDIKISKINLETYRLHICMDMLISDVQSNFTIFRELGLLYTDKNAVLPKLELSFRDYVIAEQTLKESEHFTSAQEYWLNRIEDFPSAPNLPMDKNPAELVNQRFVRKEFHIEKERWNKLKQHAEQFTISPTVLVLTCYAQILGTWSKDKHFALNLTLFNRLPLHPQVQDIVGDFTSSLLLELLFDSSKSFIERAQAVQSRLWQDLDHKVFSGVSVIRELNRRNHGQEQISMPVVFTSMLGMFNEETDNQFTAQEVDNIDSGEEHFSISQTSQVWLDHQVLEQDGGLTLVWDAIDELFPDQMLDQMFNSYTEIFSLLTNQATWSQSLASIPKEQLVVRNLANSTDKELSETLLHQVFTKYVKESPNKVAIQQGDKTISYQQLDLWTDSLAANLISKGAKNNELIAIIMDKSWEQVIAAIAILKSGAAYLPINIELPKKRIEELLNSGNCRLAVIQDEYIPSLKSIVACDLLSISDYKLNNIIDVLPVREQSWMDLAYVIFTSGSTGKPKGVVIDHRGAVNTVLDINERFDVSDSDSVLALSSLSFDLSVYDIFGLLAAGGTIIIPTKEQSQNPEKWMQLIHKHEISVWNTVPALMGLLVDHVESSENQNLDSLNLVMMSGDWIPVELPERITAISSIAKVISLGGATEASIWSIYHQIEGPTKHLTSIPYGKPLTNQSFYVLDEQMQSCPDWVAGHLYIGGVGVAKGYWRDNKRTNNSFIQNKELGMLYKTGDLGRYTEDGIIEFLGREDSQVKVQGYRVELGEIETTLQQHPKVSTAVVNTIKDNKGGITLAAYVIPNIVNEYGSENKISGQVLQSVEERNLFKLEQKGVRILSSSKTRVPLTSQALNKYEFYQINEQKAAKHSLTKECFKVLFSGLRQVTIDENPLPKYFYPSASSLYSVQLYIEINNDLDGIPTGLYYYSGKEHALIHISDNLGTTHTDSIRLHWVADMSAIRPLYPENEASNFIYLEIGYIKSILDLKSKELMLEISDNWSEENTVLDESLLPSESRYLGFSQLMIGSDNNTNISTTIEEVDCNQSVFNEIERSNIIELPKIEHAEVVQYNVLQRQSFRKFKNEAITMLQISNLLKSIQPSMVKDLEVLVYIKPGKSDRASQGWYYYCAQKHQLISVQANDENETFYQLFSSENIELAKNSGLGLFILQSSKSNLENLIDVGSLSQELMANSWANNIGLCPIGNIKQSYINDLLSFTAEKFTVAHSLLGGLIEEQQCDSWELESPGHQKEKIEDELITFLEARLPSYMVPKLYIPIDKVPLSSNGKVDRKSLPQPFLEKPKKSSKLFATTPLQLLLTDVWSEELSLDNISIDENFFEIGGNSLIAMRIISKLKTKHNIEINLRAMFERATIKDLSSYLEENSSKKTYEYSNIYSFRKEGRVNQDSLFPLTANQSNIFAYSQLHDDKTAYNIPTALQIVGHLDVNILKQALQQILARHDALRTRFAYHDGTVSQKVDSYQNLSFEYYNLMDMATESEIQSEIKKHINTESMYEFNMFEGQMLQSRILCFNDERHILILNVHHIISDFMSMDIISKELIVLYQSLLENSDFKLPELKLQFQDYILWQQAFMKSEEGEKQFDYWMDKLDGLTEQILPDDSIPLKTTKPDEWLTYNFSPTLQESLQSRASSINTTMFVMGLAAIQQLIYNQTGQQDIAIGTPISSRFNHDLERIVGLMLDTLVIRMKSSKELTANDLLLNVKQEVMSAFDNKEIPVEYLQNEVKRTASGDLYRVRYVYRKIETSEATTPNELQVSAIDIERTKAKFDLLITINESKDGLSGEFEYRSSVLQKETVKSMIKQFKIILHWLASNEQNSLQDLSNQLKQIENLEHLKEVEKLKSNSSTKLKGLRRKRKTEKCLSD